MRIGDVLALGASKAAPAGLLGRITALHLADDGVLVTTVPATLAQAVPDGAFSLQRRVAVPVPADASPLAASAPRVRRRRRPERLQADRERRS